MAVVNALVTHNASSKVVDVDIAARFLGGVTVSVPFSFELAAADDNASIYRFASIPANAILISLKLLSDATAGISDAQFGIYKPLAQGGAVIDVDCLMASTDITAGKAVLTEVFVPSIADVGKPVATLAAVTDINELGNVDVALTTPTGPTAAGTISGVLQYVLGV
jgi:hypothetical protein